MNSLNFYEKVDLPLNYILPSIDEDSANIPAEYRRCTNDELLMQSEVRLFILFRKVRYLIIPSEIPSGLNIDIFPLSLLSACDLKTDEVYHINTGYLKGKSLTKVSLGSNAMNNGRFVVDDSNFFILCNVLNDCNCVKIEKVVRFTNVFIQDRPEPKIMVVILNNESTMVLNFEDYNTWINLKNKFEKRSRECKDNDLRLLKSFIQDTI